MLAGIIGSVLVVWLVLSILNQFSFSFFRRAIAQHDKCLLLPKWTFFAPKPGCTDLRLLYRDFDEREQPSVWMEVRTVRRRALSDAIWHPDKRLSKGLFDLGQSLMLIREEYDNPTVLMTSVPYVALARYVECLPRDASVKYRQFMLAETHGIFVSAGPNLLMRSGIHNVCH